MEIDYNTFIKNNMKVIDLRDEKKFEINHFKNSINVEFTKLIVYPEKYLHKDTTYLLVCDYGITSKKTSVILNNQGYKTYSLKGGMEYLNK